MRERKGRERQGRARKGKEKPDLLQRQPSLIFEVTGLPPVPPVPSVPSEQHKHKKQTSAHPEDGITANHRTTAPHRTEPKSLRGDRYWDAGN